MTLGCRAGGGGCAWVTGWELAAWWGEGASPGSSGWKAGWNTGCGGSAACGGTPGGATASSGMVAAGMFGTMGWQGRTREATVV